jgi:hypothetical protein
LSLVDDHVWLDTPLKPLHVAAYLVEFREAPPE